MACRFEVTLPPSDHAAIKTASQALTEADRLERQLTIFDHNSEVSYINRNAASNWVAVDSSLFSLLLLCQQLSSQTQGAFDVTAGPLSECWGFLKRDGRTPEPQEIETARSSVGFDKMLLLDRKAQTVRFQKEGVQLNFGSIGKGHAVDCVAARMRPSVRSALITAGSSSLLAIGSPNSCSPGWIVGVRHPGRLAERLVILNIRDCAMATSGCEEQYFEHNGKRYGHIIDPRSGHPADQIASATVVAGSAAVADALATAFFVGGAAMAEQYCSTHPGIVAIMLANGSRRPVIFGSHPGCSVDISQGRHNV